MKNLPVQFAILFIAICLTVPSTAAAQSAEVPVVRAVLFYSPNCPHCHIVINEVLLPMLEEYGDQLQVVGIDTYQAAGSQLYQAAIELYQISPERRGVPALAIHDVVLVGSQEIPDRFPALVKEGLAAGGIDWPGIPGLEHMLAEPQPEPEPEPEVEPEPEPEVEPESEVEPEPEVESEPEVEPEPEPEPEPSSTSRPPTAANPVSTSTALPRATPTLTPAVLIIGEDELPPAETQDSPSADPDGFALAGVVLAGMIAALGYAGWRTARPPARQHILTLLRSGRAPLARVCTWAIPCLCLVGLGVASYLAYVEVNQVEAVCGPIGECNIVQTSEYALLLGVPIAVWGVLNYLAVAALWAGQRFLAGRIANLSLLGLLGMVLFGTLFSIYLTYLELFAIHAICAWCLSSAVTTTALMVLVVVPVTDVKSAPLRPEKTCA